MIKRGKKGGGKSEKASGRTYPEKKKFTGVLAIEHSSLSRGIL
jgi:hypothetical protein